MAFIEIGKTWVNTERLLGVAPGDSRKPGEAGKAFLYFPRCRLEMEGKLKKADRVVLERHGFTSINAQTFVNAAKVTGLVQDTESTLEFGHHKQEMTIGVLSMRDAEQKIPALQKGFKALPVPPKEKMLVKHADVELGNDTRVSPQSVDAIEPNLTDVNASVVHMNNGVLAKGKPTADVAAILNAALAIRTEGSEVVVAAAADTFPEHSDTSGGKIKLGRGNGGFSPD